MPSTARRPGRRRRLVLAAALTTAATTSVAGSPRPAGAAPAGLRGDAVTVPSTTAPAGGQADPDPGADNSGGNGLVGFGLGIVTVTVGVVLLKRRRAPRQP